MTSVRSRDVKTITRPSSDITGESPPSALRTSSRPEINRTDRRSSRAKRSQTYTCDVAESPTTGPSAQPGKESDAVASATNARCRPFCEIAGCRKPRYRNSRFGDSTGTPATVCSRPVASAGTVMSTSAMVATPSGAPNA